MRLSRWIAPTFVVEAFLLVIAAPMLYFPNWFPAWAPNIALGVLGIGWVWRRWRLGIWYTPTPADWPIFFLFAVMLPVSIWAAPSPLREEYSIPRAYILLWNFCLFWTFVTHASRSWQSAEWALGSFAFGALVIALVAPLGMNWLYKFPGAEGALSAIPAPMRGVFQGAENGFHPNQVAGTLLYAFPLLLAITVEDATRRRRTLDSQLVTWLVWASTPVIGLSLLVTQSRSSLLGLAGGLTIMTLVKWRRGHWALPLSAFVLAIAAPFLLPGLVDAIGGIPSAEAFGGTSTLAFRQDVWTQAIIAVHDFPFTGMGLGTFRTLVFYLYPIQIYPTYNIGHAHNYFLQAGVDLGTPGMIAVIAIFLAAYVQAAYTWSSRGPDCKENDGSVGLGNDGGGFAAQVWGLGFIGALAAASIYGQIDAVALGSKTDCFSWMLLALVFGVANLYTRAAIRAEGSR